MPERLRAHRAGIDRLLQHVLAGVVRDDEGVNVDREDLSILLDALPVAVLVSTDRACSRIWGNLAARQLYRLPPGQNFSRTAAPDDLPPFEVYSNDRPVAPEKLPLQKAALTGQIVAQSECEIRFRDGRKIYIAGHSIPIRNKDGEVTGSIGAFIDLTPQRREMEILQTVSREMSHRLKNVLAVVQSISRRTLKPTLGDSLYEAYEERLICLARYQDLLVRQNWQSHRIGDILEIALQAVGIDATRQTCRTGPDVSLSAANSIPFSMIVHELATNALKYGALSAAEGRISVSWESEAQDGARLIRFEWHEIGGPRVHPPEGPGFGTTMMLSMTAALPGGKIDLRFEPQGLTASLRFRADDQGVQSLN